MTTNNTENVEQTVTNTNSTNDKQKKEKPKKVDNRKMAHIETISIPEFIEVALLNKAITENDIEVFSNAYNKIPNTLTELMDGFRNINPQIEQELLIKVFHQKYNYKLLTDDKHNIPVIVKSMFDEKNPVEDKFFKKKDALNILGMDLVIIDINWDTMSVLMKTPEVPKDFQEKITPFMKSKQVSKVQILLTTKELFDYYKENLTYNVINNIL